MRARAALAAACVGIAVLVAGCEGQATLPPPELMKTPQQQVHLNEGIPGWTVEPFATEIVVGSGGRPTRQCRQQVFLVGTGPSVMVAESPFVSVDPDSPATLILGKWGIVVKGPGTFTVQAECDFVASTTRNTVVAKFDPNVAWSGGTDVTALQQADGTWQFTAPGAGADSSRQIAYTVSSPGTAGCSIVSSTSSTIVRVTGNGTCDLTATAYETSSYFGGSATRTLTVSGYVAPAPAPAPTCNGIIGDGGVCIPPHSG